MGNFPIELVFLLVAGLISLINWLVERAAKIRKEAAKAQKRRESRAGVDLEKLGSPRPPPEKPAQETPEKLPLPEPRFPIPPPIGGPQPEPERPRPEPLTKPQPLTKPGRPAPAAPAPASAEGPPVPRRARRRPPRRKRRRKAPVAAPAPVSRPADGAVTWRTLLRSRSGARTGFVLGEILGPPVARRRGTLPPR